MFLMFSNIFWISDYSIINSKNNKFAIPKNENNLYTISTWSNNSIKSKFKNNPYLVGK